MFASPQRFFPSYLPPLQLLALFASVSLDLHSRQILERKSHLWFCVVQKHFCMLRNDENVLQLISDIQSWGYNSIDLIHTKRCLYDRKCNMSHYVPLFSWITKHRPQLAVMSVWMPARSLIIEVIHNGDWLLRHWSRQLICLVGVCLSGRSWRCLLRVVYMSGAGGCWLRVRV